MHNRISLFVALLLCVAVWAFAEQAGAAPVHGARGIIFGEYQLHVAAEPAAVQPGSPVRLVLTVTDPQGAQLAILEPGSVPELGLVRAGLDVFTLLHPEMGTDGSFTLTLTFPVAGTYYLYLGFRPQGGSAVTAMAELAVEGDPPAPLPLEVHVPGRILSETLGADITLDKAPGAHTISLALCGPDGAPLTDLDPVPGDLVIVSGDGREFFHARPVSAEGEKAVFEAAFPSPGTYKAWALFQRAGKPAQLPFALQIGGE